MTAESAAAGHGSRCRQQGELGPSGGRADQPGPVGPDRTRPCRSGAGRRRCRQACTNLPAGINKELDVATLTARHTERRAPPRLAHAHTQNHRRLRLEHNAVRHDKAPELHGCYVLHTNTRTHADAHTSAHRLRRSGRTQQAVCTLSAREMGLARGFIMRARWGPGAGHRCCSEPRPHGTKRRTNGARLLQCSSVEC